MDQYETNDIHLNKLESLSLGYLMPNINLFRPVVLSFCYIFFKTNMIPGTLSFITQVTSFELNGIFKA